MIKSNDKKVNQICKLILLSLCIIFFYAPSCIAANAITIKIKPSAIIDSKIITLGDVANIEISRNFECDINGFKNIKLAESSVSCPNKKISADEIKNIIAQKVKLPAGENIKFIGAMSCKVKKTDNTAVITKNFKNEFLKKLEENIADLFKKKFSQKYSIKPDDTLKVKITGAINDNLIKRIISTDEVIMECVSYKSGLIQVKINTQQNSMIYGKVTKTGIVYKAKEKIMKKNPAGMKNKVYEGSVTMAPEKFCDAITPESNFNFDGFLENSELITDVAIDEVLWHKNIKKRMFIRAGQRITLNVLNAKTSLSFDAVAEKSGGIGEVITVLNPKTGRKYQAEIIAAGAARTL